MTVTVIRAVYNQSTTIFNFCFLWKVFHCVHFECPANQKEPSICGSDRTDSRSIVWCQPTRQSVPLCNFIEKLCSCKRLELSVYCIVQLNLHVRVYVFTKYQNQFLSQCTVVESFRNQSQNLSTVEPRYNEPLYNEILSVTNCWYRAILLDPWNS